MATNPPRCMLVAGALVALAGLASLPAAAAQPNGAAARSDEAPAPIVVAQASPQAATGDRVVVPVGAYPPEQRGVRQAASEGPEALRRYIWRTRMIYNYYFPDVLED